MGISGIFLATLALEFFIMFTGMTMFSDKINLLQIVLHLISCTASALFVLKNGHYRNLWKIWIGGGIIPLILEICSFISAKVHFKRIIKEN